MIGKMIKTIIQCQNIAPIENLDREINSNSLKIGVFANNGSGKTFISRLFRLTEKGNELKLNEDGKSPTDKIISLGKNKANFSFKIIDRDGIIKENFKIQIEKDVIPIIPKTEYLYHTFNQDYVEENIRALSYEKDSEIEGFILGKLNIDLKDDEDKLIKIQKEGSELTKQIESEINLYVEKNISNIQNIKRLGEFKILEPQNIFAGIEKEKYNVSKSFNELLEDYNKVKSAPENLEDIQKIEKLDIDFFILDSIKASCKKPQDLSSFVDDFKLKLKKKQYFIQAGIELYNQDPLKTNCPFCEQNLETNALHLIDDYTKYLNDSEAKVIKFFKDFIVSIEKYIAGYKNIEIITSKRINEFNTYKTKYIPSSKEIDLNEIDTKAIINEFEVFIDYLNKKLEDVSKIVIINDDLFDSIEKNEILINRLIDTNNNEINLINNKKDRIGEENKAIRKEICKCSYNYLIDQYKTNIKNVYKLRNDWKNLNEEIKKKKEQQKVSKREKVASTIKIILNYFFADKYTLDEDTFRLIFHRNILEKNQAKDVLSEGEKNIVAFAYFVGDTHLKVEHEDDYEKIFFIIDDPISSMDFSHVYTLCGVIKDIGKIIDKLKKDRFLIFTHNNDFMRVIGTNNIVDKKLYLKNDELKDFNNNLTVPYVNHLYWINSICIYF
jgi:hypothetical protein